MLADIATTITADIDTPQKVTYTEKQMDTMKTVLRKKQDQI